MKTKFILFRTPHWLLALFCSLWLLSGGWQTALAETALALPQNSPQPSSLLPASATVPPNSDSAPSPAVMTVAPQPTEEEPATPHPELEQTGAAVTLLGQTLFRIYADNSVYTAHQRAEIISRRLTPLIEKIDLSPISVTYEHEMAIIVRKGETLMTVTEQDAAAAQLSLPQLAEFYAQTLRSGLEKAQVRHNMRSLILDAVLAVLLTLGLLMVLVLLWRLFPWFFNQIDRLRQRFLPELRLKQVVLVSSSQLSQSLHFVLNILRNGLVLLLLYVYLPLLLSIFPWTQNYSHTLLTYITVPLGKAFKAVLTYIPNIFIILLIIAGTYYTLKLIRLIFRAFEQGLISYHNFQQEWARPTYAIVRFLVLAFAAVVIFPYLPGSGSPAFQSVSLFLGVLFSLGSSSAIANIVSGVVLTYMSPFQIGDRVKISDTVGDVIEKGLLVTRIRTIKNVRITIPNSMVLNSHIVNYSTSARREGLILHTSVTIGYDVPWQKVHESLLEAAQRVPHILQEKGREPFVLQTALEDFYVAYELNVYTDHPNRMAVTYSALHQHIQDVFGANGIEIMSPHFSALRDGNAVNIPPQHLPPNYQAPGFKFFS